MHQLDLGKGEHGIVDYLLPGDGKDGFIHIIIDWTFGVGLNIGGEVQLLSVQKLRGLIHEPLQLGGAGSFPVAGLIGNRRGCGGIADAVLLFL